ncbi:MAG: hypothetical protein RLZZ31_1024 [Actinomycetota bacterium]
MFHGNEVRISLIVENYLLLGLRIGRHIDGFVDAYYGPATFSDRVQKESLRSPAELEKEAKELLTQLDNAEDAAELSPERRRWLRAQAIGLLTTCQKLSGANIEYRQEVERCYGVMPTWRDEEVFASAHRLLDEVLPGDGDLRERMILWKEEQAVEREKLSSIVQSIAEDFRSRTQSMFGLPDGEHINWEFATNQPWSGFNYYEGNLQSRVAINIDLPVLATSLGHLIAHEAYPGHHTEHTRKEVGLVRKNNWMEESIFCVGTPQCLLAEGLADLGLEILLGTGVSSDHVVSEHLQSYGVAYDADMAANVRQASGAIDAVRANAAWMLHQDGRPAAEVVPYLMKWGLMNSARAEKAVEFLTSPVWGTYISCYVEGFPLCRSYVNGEPEKFRRLLTDQLVPADLAA